MKPYRPTTHPEEPPGSLGARIRAVRTAQRRTLAEVAGRRLTRMQLSAIERGTSQPSLGSLRYIARRLRVDPAYFIDEEEPKPAGSDALASTDKPNRSLERRAKVSRALHQENPLLARIYEGMVAVLDGSNVDRLAMAAHQARELMEKWNRQGSEKQVSLGDQVRTLRTRHAAAKRATTTVSPTGEWVGTVDDALRDYLAQIETFLANTDEQRPPTASAMRERLSARSPLAPLESHVPTVDTWNSLRDYFVRVSHHQVTTTASAFEERLADLENLILLVLAPEQLAFSSMDSLDDLIAIGEAGPVPPALVDRVAALLVGPGIQTEYFFGRIKSARWIGPLRKKGFFGAPPPPVTEGRGISFPFWPQSRYLINVAAQDPAAVTEVFAAVADTTNLTVHHDLVTAAMAMPIKDAATLADVEIRWIKKQDRVFFLLPHETGKLIARLAHEGAVKSALSLAKAYLRVLPDPEPPEPSEEPFARRPKPHVLIEEWEYGDLLKTITTPLAAAAPRETLGMLVGSLRAYFEESKWLPEQNDDGSNLWRDLLDSGAEPHDVREMLAFAVYDAANKAVAGNALSLSDVVGLLKAARWPYFLRVALDLLLRYADRDHELVKTWLLDRVLVGTSSAEREYGRLARAHFGLIADADRAAFVTQVVADAEAAHQKWVESLVEEVPPEWISRRLDDAILSALAPFEPWLTGVWRERWIDLSARLRPPDFDAPKQRSWAVWSGPRSPKTKAELAAMPPREVVAFLRDWRPDPAEPFRFEKDGLADVFSNLVTETPAPFAEIADAFADLDPAYVGALLNGLQNALRANATFDWTKVLELIDKTYQPMSWQSGGAEADDYHRHPMRWAVPRLVDQGLLPAPGSLPAADREQVKVILSRMVSDDDRSQYAGRTITSGWDGASVALNSLAGRAVGALTNYAVWVRRVTGDEDESVRATFSGMPEVGEMLDALLVRGLPHIHAAIGLDFTRLLAMDRGWMRSRLDRVFPKNNPVLRGAAWKAYLTYSRPYDEVFHLLRSEYELAVDDLKSAAADANTNETDRKLAEHLFTFYMRGLFGLEGGGLFDAFWRHAPSSHRVDLIRHIGHGLEESGRGLRADLQARVRELFEHRIAAAQSAKAPTSFVDELAAIGWWARPNSLDPAWLLDRIVEVLEVTGKIDVVRYVVDYLAQVAEREPKRVLDVLDALARRSADFSHIHVENLEVALRAPLRIVSLEGRAREIAERLANLGFVGLRALFVDRESDALAKEAVVKPSRRRNRPVAGA